jgi:hypothetical protein
MSEPPKVIGVPDRGFKICGKCGKSIRPSKHSLKTDGWHWHRACWLSFLRASR